MFDRSGIVQEDQRKDERLATVWTRDLHIHQIFEVRSLTVFSLLFLNGL